MIERIGNVYYRVADIEESVTCYTEVLGLDPKFRDADDWAAFDVNGSTLALEGTHGLDASGEGGATVSLRVGDLDTFRDKLAGSPGISMSDPITSAHERRLDLGDPSGNLVVVYQPVVPSDGG